MGLTAATNVNVGTKTISFFPIPNDNIARCRPAVPLWHATAPDEPTYFVTLSSNSSICFPAVETHVDSITSKTYFFSFPLKLGIDKGIICSIIYYLPYILYISVL